MKTKEKLYEFLAFSKKKFYQPKDKTKIQHKIKKRTGERLTVIVNT